MSNSDEIHNERREKIYSFIWGSLIFVGLIWWFYPQIRELIQPEKSNIEVGVPTGAADSIIQGDEKETELEVQKDADIEGTNETEVLSNNAEIEVSEETIAADETTATEEIIITDETIITEQIEVVEPETKPEKKMVPKFDIVRVEDDGSAVIAGIAEGYGYVVLSVDGRELQGARADLTGNGQFVIFALLPSKDEPQALQLWHYLEGETDPIISEDIVFVTVFPKVVVPDVADVVDEIEENTELNNEVAVAEVESNEESPSPEVIVADEDGVRVLQDGDTSDGIANVSIDTISYDLDGQVVVGGRAGGNGVVRVYIDNQIQTTSQITDNGYWKASLMNIEPGIYTLRADEISKTGEVISRTEIPFKREEPAELVEMMAEEAVDDENKLDPDTKISQTQVIVQDTVGGLAASTSSLQSDEVKSNMNGSVKGLQPTVDRVKTPALSVEFRVKTVQPGATLWAIAKESYGAGIEYHKVFEANKERIRDPDLIYPGQVFEIPD